MIFGFFRKKAAKPQAGTEVVQGEKIGKITHYFPHSKAGVIKLESTLNIGDMIRVKGHTTDFKQKIDSMQIDGKDIAAAKRGDEIGILVKGRVRGHDLVYKI